VKIAATRAARSAADSPELPGIGVVSLTSGIALATEGSRLQSITRRE